MTATERTSSVSEVGYNAGKAVVSTVHLTVRPDHVIAADSIAIPAGNVVVGLALDAPVDVEAVEKELTGYGTIAAVLLQGSPVFDYQDGLWAILEDGALFAVVAGDGILSFPAIDTAGKSRLAPEPITVGSLEFAGSTPG